DYVTRLRSYLQNRADYTKLISPEAAGINSPVLSQMISELARIRGELHAMRDKEDVKSNPYYTELIKAEQTTLATVKENLASIEQFVSSNITALERQRNQIKSNQTSLPAKEQELYDLQRAYNLTNEVNNLLMSRRMETEVVKASSRPDNEVLEFASSGILVSPTYMLFAIGLFAGLALPILVIVLLQFLNNKIQSEEDINEITTLPVIGHIVMSTEGKQMVTMDHPTAPITEAFRALRTSFDYIVKGKGHKVIMFTSSTSGEGKTFCALNLAGVLAMAGKKTILLGFDLRKPRLGEYAGVARRDGITNFLIGQARVEDLIIPYRPNLDLMVSGATPPNPADLIDSENTEELFRQLKEKYDYIVVDTSPVGLVTDALILSRHSDLNIYVIRPKFTVKPVFENTLAQMEKSNMSKLGLLVNGIIPMKNRYGYGYGYGYGSGYGYGYGYDEKII
ncbi:MAG: polysaccharide biosynthesis tyrosine autokinase, partial [Paludibacter sp.]